MMSRRCRLLGPNVMFVFILAVVTSVMADEPPLVTGADSSLNHSVEMIDRPASSEFILTELWYDFSYLALDRDMLLTVSGLAAAPQLLSKPFRIESPEFTENWGTSQGADNFFEGGEVLGDGRFPLALAASSWGLGKLSGSSQWQSFGALLFRTQVLNGLYTTALKLGINRQRPNGGRYSYPSGHTSSAFAAAGVVYSQFGRTWGIPAFAAAGYVGLSRLQEGKHYLSDVVAGGILGTLISLKLAGRRNRRRKLSVSPARIGNATGFSLAYHL